MICQVFEALKRDDPDVLQEREKAVRERVQAQYERAQQRLQDLVSPKLIIKDFAHNRYLPIPPYQLPSPRSESLELRTPEEDSSIDSSVH